jgi:LytR cell envelope-related transcriptional attenuator
LAGLVLMGIALIAVVLGIVSLIGDGDSNQGGGGTSSSQPPTPPPGSETTEPSGQPGQSTTPSQPNQPTQPGGSTATQPPQPPQPPPPNPREVPVRVFNNGTITGLAAQAARDFRADGWNVVEVGNYSQGIIPTTTAYFRPGTNEEAAARALAAKFNMRAEPRFAGIANASPGVIVLITNDYGGK